MFLFFVFLISCQSKTNSATTENSKTALLTTDTSTVTLKDSLDTDSSAFILTNLPDSVRQMFSVANHKLFDYIIQSYTHVENHDTLFSMESLKLLMLKDKFEIDSSAANKVILWSSQFNKREQLECSRNKKIFTILITNQLWYLGKKYESLMIKILPKRKNELEVTNF